MFPFFRLCFSREDISFTDQVTLDWTTFWKFSMARIFFTFPQRNSHHFRAMCQAGWSYYGITIKYFSCRCLHPQFMPEIQPIKIHSSWMLGTGPIGGPTPSMLWLQNSAGPGEWGNHFRRILVVSPKKDMFWSEHLIQRHWSMPSWNHGHDEPSRARGLLRPQAQITPMDAYCLLQHKWWQDYQTQPFLN